MTPTKQHDYCEVCEALRRHFSRRDAPAPTREYAHKCEAPAESREQRQRQEYAREYRARPEVRARWREYVRRYRTRPEVRERERQYARRAYERKHPGAEERRKAHVLRQFDAFLNGVTNQIDATTLYPLLQMEVERRLNMIKPTKEG